jgi:hypothetical protein
MPLLYVKLGVSPSLSHYLFHYTLRPFFPPLEAADFSSFSFFFWEFLLLSLYDPTVLGLVASLLKENRG